jgi:hypothetical protein
MVEGKERRDEGGEDRGCADIANDRNPLAEFGARKPPIESNTIAIKMSDGTFPVRANAAMTASRTTKTGSGTMPIL